MTFQDYSLCGLRLRVEVQDSGRAESIHQLLGRFFALGRLDNARGEASLHLQFLSHDQDLRVTAIVEEIFDSPNLRGARTDRGFFLECGPASGPPPGPATYPSSIVVDLSQGRATGQLSSDFWDQPLHYQRELFLLPLVMLLHTKELFPLHANGVANEGVGVLIVGDPGSGKTTLTISLLLAGWDFLSDDVVTLKGSPAGIEVLALRRGLSCTRDTLAHFPQLGAGVQEFAPPDDHKRYIDTSERFEEQTTHRCQPRLILFPNIGERSRSQLKPLGQSETLVELGKQSAGIMTDVELARKQMRVLVALIGETDAYQITLGEDIFQNPKFVHDLIWGAIINKQ